MKKITLSFVLLLMCISAFSQNPLLLKDVYPGATGSSIQEIVKTSNYTFFNAEDDDADADRGLYRTDGTTSGTIKLNLSYLPDPPPSPNNYSSTKAEKLTALGNKIIFAGDNFSPGYGEIWASDGTQAGTIALERFTPTANNRGPVLDMAAMNGFAYYSVIASNNKLQLRRTDGTPAGTSLVYEFSSFTTSPETGLFKVINGVLYFDVYDRYGAGNDMVWRSDGTAAGTYQLRDMGTEYFLMGYFMEPVNGSICFMTGKFSNNNSVLFKTDGTPAGTVPVYEFASIYNNNLYPSFALFENSLYFSAHDGVNGKELWKTDGTAAGTVLVADINTGSASSNPLNLTILNGDLYLTATTVAEGTELRKYSANVVSLVKDIYPGPGNGYTASAGPISKLVVSNGTLLFSATNNVSGLELWITDGTTANTRLAADINSSGASSPSLLTPGNPVYFSANNGVNGVEIFTYDNSQGVSGLHKLYVNDNSLIGDVFTTAVGNNANNGLPSAPFATIDHALNQALAGDTIFVDAGTYPMANLTINKAITILGSNYSVSPNNSSDKTQYNTGRNAEARITGGTFIIGADGIFINGLRFSSNTAISLNGDYSHIKFNKNYFDVATAANTVTLQGISVAPVVAFDFAATDNRFERTDNLTGNALFLGAVKSLLIDDNVFIESGPIVNRSTAIRTSTTLPVENAAISNNYLKKLNQAIAPFILQNTSISTNKFDSCFQGIVYFPGNIVSNNVSINSNNFYNLRQSRSVLVRNGAGGGINNLNVSGNTINQSVDGTGGIVSMIQLEFTAANNFGAANVIGNKINISGNYALTNVGSNCGIQLTGKHSNTTIAYNELNFTAINYNVGLTPGVLPPVPAGIYINTDGSTTNGLIPATAVININNNKIIGFKQSVVFYDPVAGVTPVIGYGYLTTGASVNINNNSFTDDSISIDNGTTSQLVNATCNWYGASGAEVVIPGIKGPVTFTPWLVNGTDNDAVATGFQPVVNSCTGRQNKFYVNDAVQTGDVFTTAIGNNSNSGIPSSPFATPDYAYSIAQAGDTIYVDAGTYDLGGLTYSFPKAMVFLGTNYLVSPNDPANKILLNAARNAESILANGKMLIAGNGLSMEGFTWDVGNRTGVELVNTAPTNNDFGNYRFTKNIYKITHTNANLNSFAITGKFVTSPALPVTSGYNITDNRFEKSGTAAGSTLNFNYVKNISVTDNSFVVTGSTLRTQQAINLGGIGITDAVTFSNNRVEDASAGVGGNRIAGAVITGNKMHNISNAFANTNSMPESSSIEFSNNELANDLGTPFILYNRIGTGTTNIFKVENNIITGSSVATVNQLFASMNLTFSNTALNPSFIIRGNKINYSGDFSAVESQFFRPITVRGNIANVTLENNEVTLSNAGGLGPVNPATALPVNPAFSIITDNGATSYMPSNALINVLNNKVHGYKQSVVFYDVASAGRDAYTGYGNIPAGATVNIHNNSFTGDSVSINNGTASQTVNGSCNWYGSAAAQNVLPKISLATVNYIPWLVNGTDSDVATGFQPVGGNCNGTAMFAVITQSTNITCNGVNNGAVDVTISGGSTPYNFAWSKDNVAGFSNTEDLTSMAAGVYELIVTDANGSADTVTATITEPAVFTAAATGTNVSCFGNANGTASVNVTGGTAPYTYLWSNAATNSSISGLAAGNYTVTVTDANGCTKTAAYLVTQPDLLIAVASGTNVSCFSGSNGTAVVAVTGGTAPYTYFWSNAATTSSISGLAAGNYTVTVTDANGCTKTATYLVTQPNIVVAVASGNNVSCFGNANGTASVNVSGGTTPYTYLWSNAAITSSISGLVPGNYNVTVTDANGCFVSGNYLVTQPTLLIAVAGGTNVSCFGGSNGTAAVTATGGATPYTYLWSNAATTSTISSLAAGNYTVTVTDANGCTKPAAYLVTQPNIVIAVASGTNVSCFGAANGTAVVTATGGATPYTYLWSNAATTSAISGLAAGNYTVTVTDANGCTKTAAYLVTQPAILTVVMSGTTANCNGSATATPAGGTAPYTYNWSNGGITQTISSIPAGTYTVTVTDANNCTVNGSRTVTGNSSINPTANVINVSCFGTSTGSVTVTGAGGVAPRTYNINGSAFQPGNVFANLAAGVYVVGAKDANGCVDFVTKTITQPTLLTVALDSAKAACFGTNNGRIYITANGGTGAKTYNWTGPNGYTSTTQDPNNLFGGTYNLLVTDAKGCTAGLTAIVIERPAITISEVVTNVGCRGDLTGAINATVTGGSGSGFTYRWTGPNGFVATTQDVTGIKAGNYTFTVTDNANGCAVVKTIIVTQPANNLDLTTAKTNVTGCNSLGTITATGSGGTSPYQYKLDNGSYQSSGSFTNLQGGTYTVWVKDANGCTTSKVVTITDTGSDQYEGNNSKTQASLINIGSTINARIAVTNDIDWFKFVTPAGGGNFILSLTHPSVSFTFNMYPAGNNAPALGPVSTTATSKEYVLSGNSTYYISVTQGLSYVCYNLMVAPPTSFARTITPEITTDSNSNTVVVKENPVVAEIANPSVKAYPNPHQGSFKLQIASAQTGTAKIELFTITGQKLQERTVSLQKSGNNVVPFTVTQYGTILYRVKIGDKILTGKVLSMN